MQFFIVFIQVIKLFIEVVRRLVEVAENSYTRHFPYTILSTTFTCVVYHSHEIMVSGSFRRLVILIFS